MEIPPRGLEFRDRRSQKPICAPRLTNQQVQRQRNLGVLKEGLYQGLKRPHREITGAEHLCSGGAESARVQAAEAGDVAGG
jgi:hypothetical protein